MVEKRKRKSSGSRDEATSSSSAAQPVNDNQPYHPHDRFFKLAFENKAIAVDFFVAHLAEAGLTREVLEKFELSSNEHLQPFRPYSVSDVVYRGQIGDRTYYLIIEHQSSRDAAMTDRFVEYSLASRKEHAAQGLPGNPVVLSICLYHETAASLKKTHGKSVPWGYTTSLGDSALGKEADKPSWLTFKYKLVDLTVMEDTEISEHGQAAIIEWILKHASSPDDDFVQQAKERVKKSVYSSEDIAQSNLVSAIAEYIMAVYDGDKSKNDLEESLCEVMPQGRDTMGKLADKIRAEGKAEGKAEGVHEEDLRIAQRMMDRGFNRETIKQLCTELLEGELSQLSPNRRETTPPPHTSESALTTGLLVQSIAGISGSESSGEVPTVPPYEGYALGTPSPVHKRHRNERNG